TVSTTPGPLPDGWLWCNVGTSTALLSVGCGECCDDFVVCHLIEVLVPVADCAERVGFGEADHAVRDFAESLDGLRGPHWHRHCERTWQHRALGLQGRGCADTGGQAVVDDNHVPAFTCLRRTIGPVFLEHALRLGLLCRAADGEIRAGEAELPEAVRVVVGFVPRCGRPDPQFGMTGRTDLAYHTDLKWRGEFCGDCRGDEDATAREAGHQRIMPVVVAQCPGQFDTGTVPVRERTKTRPVLHTPVFPRRMRLNQQRFRSCRPTSNVLQLGISTTAVE